MHHAQGSDRSGRRGSTAGTPMSRGWQALHVAGSLREARGHLQQAYAEAERAGDDTTMARAASELGGLWVHEHRQAAETALVRHRQQRALARTPPGTPEHLALRLRLAAEEDYVDRRHDRITELLPAARRLRDPQILATALSLAHHCLLAPEHATARRALAEEMLDVATTTDRPGDLLIALLWRTVDGFLDGDPLAERSLAELTARLAGHDHLAVGFCVQALRVMLLVREGRMSQAQALAVRCVEAGQRAGDLDAAGWLAAHQVAIGWFTGTLGDLAPQLEQQVHSPTLSDIDNALFSALAVAAACAGDQRRATLALSRLGSGDLSSLPRSSTWTASVYGAIEAAHLLGARGTARRGYELLRPFADRPIMVSLAVSCFGSVEHALGLAALTLGETEPAVRHLRAAIRRNLAVGHWPAAVHSRFRLGQALACSDRPVDREDGRLEQARALAEAADHGWRLPGVGARDVAATLHAPVGTGAAGDPPGPGGPRPPDPDGADPGDRADLAAPAAVQVSRRGGQWTVQWGGRSAGVKHSLGMLYLAVLLAHPGEAISSAELAAGVAGDPEVRADGAASGPQHVLDEEARRAYRRRLDGLERTLAGAGGHAPRRRDELEQERAWLAAQLAAGTARGGRSRAFANGAERARIAVGKAIRRALDQIRAADPVLGEELGASVQTGTRCCYRPEITVRVGGPPA